MRTILLVGQPNSGKSTLFNALAGYQAVTSNYPGTTVEALEAKITLHGDRVRLVDTPGIYSLSDSTIEERVTKKILLETKPDVIVNLLDVTSLEKGLYFTLQLLEASLPVVNALNFVEEARKRGIEVAADQLAGLLGIPVFAINPIRKTGIDQLVYKMLTVATGHGFTVTYDDHIEQAIEMVESSLPHDLPFSKRFFALRILEGDEDLTSYLRDQQILEQVATEIPEHPNLKQDIAVNRHGIAAYIARLVTAFTKREERSGWQERLDQILLNPRWGMVVTLSFLLAMFAGLLFLGGLVQDFLSSFIQVFILPWIHHVSMEMPGYVGMMLESAVVGTSAGIAIAIPYVFLFYFFLGVLEDLGVLPRFILMLDRLLRRLNLPGQAVIPMLLGMGCTVPATIATRILESRTDRIKVIALFTVIPCSSRTAIILGIVGHFAGIVPALGIYAIALILMIGIGLLFKRSSSSPSPLLLELPPYRRPVLRGVILKSWLRMREFVYIVIPLLIIGGASYGLLKWFGLEGVLFDPLRFITVGWLRLPKEAITPLVYGFLQKDLTPAMLSSVFGTTNLSSVMTPIQLFTFGMTSTFQMPCVVAFGMIGKELGWRWAIMLTIMALTTGLVLSGLLLRIILLFGG
jgi:ferrous iron transport protein B